MTTEAHHIIAQARTAGKRYLTDPQTKRLLRHYGIPLPREGMATSPDETVSLARAIKGPVVLKIISPDILHKSDVGGVRIGVQGDEAVREAYTDMLSQVQARFPQARVEGMLVQEYLPEGTELILGIAPDPAFRRVIMFGLGGVLVEIFRDVSFGVVPVAREQAQAMIQQTKAFTILSGARSRAMVNLDALVDIILRLSQLAEELGDEITELDINPLWVRKDGSLVAVDTRAALTEAASQPLLGEAEQPALRMEVMDRILNPMSLAVIGASNSPDKVGYLFMDDLMRRGYKGKLYPVNPRGGTILGLPAYAKVNDIPGAVDLAIIAVPPQVVPQVMQDCARKGIPGVMVNAAGFAETGTEAGKALEKEVLSIARAAGMRIVGPNCLGIYNPRISLGYLDAPELVGRVGVVAQSGSMTVRIVKFGIEHGVGFSKAISSGNESDLTLVDYIEYFGQDPQTAIIVAYVESIKDGPRFLRIARQVAARKPILIWKAGRTEAGAQAAASHTGALVSSTQVYNAAFQQAGAMAVGSFTALMDGLLLLDKIGTLPGDRVAIVSGPGGMGVALADACNDMGLSVPPFAPQTQSRLREILPSFAGTHNPVDITMAQIINQDLTRQCLKIVDDDPNIDVMITVLAAGEPSLLAQILLRAKGEVHKPLLALTNEPPEVYKEARPHLERAGIPVYDHPERVAQALAAILRKPSVWPR